LASLFSFGMVGGTAFAVLFLFVRDPQPSAAPLLPVLFFFSSCFAVVGFYGGIVGGSWLDLRSRQIHSTRRLLLESAGTGIAFGLAFACLVLLSPSYRAGSERSFHGLSLFLLLFLFGGFGCAISLIFAAAFRKRLVQ
jgi:ABC-type polysaccharide/polyol phosphate export permease